MSDKLLEKFFEPDRWTCAIEKGVGKHINKADLTRLAQMETRLEMCRAIREGRYEIAPPHTAKIPKDNGEYRTVYINEPIDRIFLSIANDLLLESAPEMIHPTCTSYQKGIGCGKVVKEVSRWVVNTPGDNIGWKADLSKYFDSVPVIYIDRAFDEIEGRFGKSAVIDVLRKYYHSDWYFDERGDLQQKYQSLKQGCAVASWLANVLLFHIDGRLSQLNGYYVRYSDDMLFIGPDNQIAMQILTRELSEMKMSLNPKKVENLSGKRWFKFLGYSIKGSQISLSKSRLKTFQKEIEKRTVKKRGNTFRKALNAVNRYLYRGDGKHSWAEQILSVCNVKHDIDELNKFAMDALRAVLTGKKRIGGLGYVATQLEGCVSRGTGRNVTSNRLKTESDMAGFLTLGCMQNALRTDKNAYRTLVSTL